MEPRLNFLAFVLSMAPVMRGGGRHDAVGVLQQLGWGDCSGLSEPEYSSGKPDQEGSVPQPGLKVHLQT